MRKKLYTVNDCKKLNINNIKKIYKKNISKTLVGILESFSFGNSLINKAEGQYIYNGEKKILDFTGGLGVLNQGHNLKKVISERIKYQNEKRMEVYKNFLSPYLAGLSHNISELLPKKLDYSFFCNSGAEAVDGAIKISYKYFNGARKYILHSDISFHGKLLGSLSISNQNEFIFPKIPNTLKYKYNDINSVKKLVKKYRNKDKSSNIYALIIEPFSASTYKMCNEQFLKDLKKICDDNKIILIFDEIYSGFFKTGKFFHFMYSKITPDILIMSKSLGGGKASISGYISNRNIATKSYDNLKDVLLHSTTYNGFGEECITAIESINYMIDNDFEKKSQIIESRLLIHLKKLKEKYQIIKKYSGKGCTYGIEFNQNYISNIILKSFSNKLVNDNKFYEKLFVTAVMEKLYSSYNILTTFKFSKGIYLSIEPSLIVSIKDIDYFFESLEKVLTTNKNILFIKILKNKLVNKFLFK